MRRNKRRLLAVAGAITAFGAAATLILGVTFGLFSATTGPLPTGTFTAGTVTLDTPVVVPCTVGPMVPGDSSIGYTPAPAGQTDPKTASCTFSVHYTGNVPAFIGVDLATTGSGLYDGSPNGLQFQIKDNGTGTYATGGVLNGGSNLYVSTDPAASTLHTFTVDYGLPTSSPNGYQGKITTLTLTVHAVQAGNNGSATGCVAGAVCPGITSWS